MNEQPQPARPRTRAHAGQIAAVRRPEPAAPKRVLRLGLVRQGQVEQERVLMTRTPVSVGINERNTFVLSAERGASESSSKRRLPEQWRLIDVEGERYVLQFDDGMRGKLSTDAGLRDLKELRSVAERLDGRYRLPLTEDVQGKITFGDCSLLFQFVVAPPELVKARLPAAVTRGGLGIDWTTTIVAAFSFLIHFLAIGAVYTDWVDPVVNYDVNVRNLVETVKNLPPPPEVEQKNVEEDKEEEKQEVRSEEKPVVKAPTPTRDTKAPLSKAEVAQLSKELDSIDMGILGTNLGNTATADVLSGSDAFSTSLMDQAAASGAGVSSGGIGGLKLGAAGGAIRPGSAGNALSSIGAAGKTTEQGSGNVAAVKGPSGNAQLGSANVAGGRVPDASSVTARMRAGIRACYNRGLNENPDASGRINLTIHVGPGGEVTSVTATATGNLPASVVDCVKGRAQSARFSPPEGGTAVVTIPVNFVKQ